MTKPTTVVVLCHSNWAYEASHCHDPNVFTRLVPSDTVVLLFFDHHREKVYISTVDNEDIYTSEAATQASKTRFQGPHDDTLDQSRLSNQLPKETIGQS